MYLAAILHHLYSFRLCARWATLLPETIFKLRYVEESHHRFDVIVGPVLAWFAWCWMWRMIWVHIVNSCKWQHRSCMYLNEMLWFSSLSTTRLYPASFNFLPTITKRALRRKHAGQSPISQLETRIKFRWLSWMQQMRIACDGILARMRKCALWTFMIARWHVGDFDFDIDKSIPCSASSLTKFWLLLSRVIHKLSRQFLVMDAFMNVLIFW